MSKISPNTVRKALCKIDKYAMEDGDIGGAEWRDIGQLLHEAAGMQARIEVLEEEIKHLRFQLQQFD